MATNKSKIALVFFVVCGLALTAIASEGLAGNRFYSMPPPQDQNLNAIDANAIFVDTIVANYIDANHQLIRMDLNIIEDLNVERNLIVSGDSNFANIGVSGNIHTNSKLISGINTLQCDNCIASGNYSAALGRVGEQPITASGDGSVAYGYTDEGSITASGDGSTALGYSSTSAIIASGIGSFAAGYSVDGLFSASGAGSVAMGLGYERINSSGPGSVAMGYAELSDIISSGSGSIAMGFADAGQLRSHGKGGASIGFDTKAFGDGSVALGYDTNANGQATVAIGENCYAVTANAICFGKDLTAYNSNQVLIQDLNSLGDSNFASLEADNAFIGSMALYGTANQLNAAGLKLKNSTVSVAGDVGGIQLLANSNGYLSLNGLADFLFQYNKITADTDGSISIWIKPDHIATNTTYDIVGYGGGAASNAGLFVLRYQNVSDVNYIRILQRSNGTATANIVSVQVNSLSDSLWHHIVLTSDGSTWKLYLDDDQKTLSVVTGSNNGNWFGDTTVSETDMTTIGNLRYNGGNVNYYAGGISNAMLFDKEIANTTVSEIYALGLIYEDYTGTDSGNLSNQWILSYSGEDSTGANDFTTAGGATFTGINSQVAIDKDLYLTGGLYTNGSPGITDGGSYWLCTASDCSTTCQVTIVNGIITGCV